MKKTIQTKRNQPTSSNYRVLYAKTGRRRRLHAATTAAVDSHVDLESDVPNIGIGRALLVILVLHILAIAAIYVHSTFFGDDAKSANQGQKPPVNQAASAVAGSAIEAPEKVAPAAAPVAAQAAVTPEATLSDPESERYIVVTGDSYQRIAQVRNVDVQALRALNSNRPLRAGVVLDLPAELSSRPVNPEPAVAVAPLVTPAESPVEAPLRAVERATSSPDVSGAPKAIVVKPNRPAPAVETGIKDSGTRYKIKSGDTLWRISNRFKVSRDAVLELNGIKDPNKLYAGREIKIPAK